MAVQPFGYQAITTAVLVASALAYRSSRKKTLSPSGAVAGFVVGFSMVATGMRGLILFYFYQVATWATRYKITRKAELDGTLQESAVRGARQVLSVSVLSTILSLWHAVTCGAEQPVDFSSDSKSYLASQLTCGILAHHACSLADTLASEMGILANTPPVLIIRPWQRVPAGTNGGITLAGTFWSLIGGLLIGLFYVATDAASGTWPLNALAMISYGGLCGVFGSLLDSLLGATVQATYYDDDQKRVYHAKSSNVSSPSFRLIGGIDILTNAEVNLVSVVITTFLGGWMIAPWFFPMFP